MTLIQTILSNIFNVDSVWSIVARAVLWFGVALVIIISTSNPNPNRSMKELKTNLGMFLMFLVLSTGLIYLLFGFSLS